MEHPLVRLIRTSPSRVPIPISVYPGLPLTGARVIDIVTSASTQAETQIALHERVRSPVMQTAMDLSAEAEAFGGLVRFADDEIPTVDGRLVTTREEIDQLEVPSPGSRRTRVHLDAASMMKRGARGSLVLGSLIGPLTLAGRLLGVSEALALTITDAGSLHALIEKTTAFLVEYARAFRAAGADGAIVAEPLAGLVSPPDLARFSSAYLRRLVEAVDSPDFLVIVHSCSARMIHLPQMLEAGARMFHFGSPMDMPAALARVGDRVILAGNLDPTSVFFQGTSEDVVRRTDDLLDATSAYPGFAPSSGCDLPPGTPLPNLEAFYAAVRRRAAEWLHSHRSSPIDRP
jgi:uroporphyrinogen decarboxylase